MDKLKIFLFVAATFSIIQIKAQRPQSKALLTVAEFGRSMAIGLSINSQNRVFVSFPNANGAGNLSVGEVVNEKLLPYPDGVWNEKGDYNAHFLRVQDLFVDAEDNLWVLDSKPAPAGNIFADGNGGEIGQFKLVKINTRNNKVQNTYLFDNLNKQKSALNDVRIDIKRQVAYLSDPAQAAIVILDLKTGEIRTVLKNTKYTLADRKPLIYDGKAMLDKKGNLFSSNVNGIALTHDFKYFYFKPINKQTLFRLETRYLNDKSLSEKELESKVEIAGKVGVTHGLIADRKGNIFLTTSEDYSISYLTPEGVVHTLIHDPNIIWPDSMGIGSDGYLYFSCAQIQRSPQWNNGEDKTEYPYRIFKVKMP